MSKCHIVGNHMSDSYTKSKLASMGGSRKGDVQGIRHPPPCKVTRGNIRNTGTNPLANQLDHFGPTILEGGSYGPL